MRWKLLALAATASGARAADDSLGLLQEFSPGNPRCPCIDPWVGLPEECRMSNDGICRQSNYGASVCEAWDCADDDPQCALRRWCYVDWNKCEMISDPTVLFSADIDADSPFTTTLSYSYATCGSLRWNDGDNDDWVFSAVRRLNRPLRVAYPSDSANGYALVSQPPGCNATEEGCEKTGSVADFVHEALESVDIQIEPVEISALSTSLYPRNSRHACTHDVGIGWVDLCIGDFSVTAERKQMTAFTLPVYVDTFFFVTQRSEDRSFWTKMLTPYSPFTAQLWGVILALVIVFAITFWFVDAEYNEADFPDEATTFLPGFGRSLYFGLLGVVVGGPVHTAKTLSAKIITLGFGFFVILIISAYTANLVSFLVRQRLQLTVSSTDTVLFSPWVMVCVDETHVSQLLQQYPQLSSRLFEASSLDQLIDSLDAGDCDVSVLSQDDFDKLQSYQFADGGETEEDSDYDSDSDGAGAGEAAAAAAVRRRGRSLQGSGGRAERRRGRSLLAAKAKRSRVTAAGAGAYTAGPPGKACNKAMIGDSIMSIGTAMPVRSDLHHQISFLISRQLQEGEYTKNLRQAQALFLTPPACASTSDLDYLGDGTMGLGEMVGPIMTFVVFIAAGVTLFLVGERHELRVNLNRLHIDKEDFQAVANNARRTVSGSKTLNHAILRSIRTFKTPVTRDAFDPGISARQESPAKELVNGGATKDGSAGSDEMEEPRPSILLHPSSSEEVGRQVVAYMAQLLADKDAEPSTQWARVRGRVPRARVFKGPKALRPLLERVRRESVDQSSPPKGPKKPYVVPLEDDSDDAVTSARLQPSPQPASSPARPRPDDITVEML